MTSVAVNCAIIYYTSRSLDAILANYDLSLLSQFMVLVAIEHGVLAYMFLYSLVVNDVPDWVVKEQEENQSLLQIAHALIEHKKTVYKEG